MSVTTTLDTPAREEVASLGLEDRRRDRLGFALVFCVVNLHLLRNVSAPLYLTLYAGVSGWIFWRYLRVDKRRALDDSGMVVGVWIAIALMGLVTSLAVVSPFGAAYGAVRFLFAVPVFFALVVFTQSMEDLRAHVATMVGFFVVASWTLPLQFLTGPISWFDDASVRGAEVRYSSLIGSLTSIGVIVGCYLALCVFLRRPWMWIALALATLPAVLSLSKAALANVVLGWLLLLWLNRRRPAVLLGATVGAPLVALLAYVAVPAVRLRIETVAGSFGLRTQAGALSNDVSVSQSIVDRLTTLPGLNWDALTHFHSPLAYVIGGGFGMGNTALVTEPDSTAPMAHNQFVELLSVFGLVGGLTQILVMVGVLVLAVVSSRRTRHPVYAVVGGMFALFLFNALLANGVVYQPSSASLLFFAMFVVLSPVIRRDALVEAASVPVAPRKEKSVTITELLRAIRQHWVPAAVVGVLAAVITLFVGQASSGGTPQGRPVESYVRVAFVPEVTSAAAAADTADFIQGQLGYWSQLAQTDETLTAANNGAGSKADLKKVRAACTLEIPALNVMELRCTGENPTRTKAFLARWSDAIAAVVHDRAVPANLKDSVKVSDITRPLTGTAAAGSVSSGTLIYPFAVVVGLVAALLTAVGLRLRRGRGGSPAGHTLG